MELNKHEQYEAPLTERAKVMLESAIMSASIFEPEEDHDEGLNIQGHEVGNVIDASDGWDDTNLNSSNLY